VIFTETTCITQPSGSIKKICMVHIDVVLISNILFYAVIKSPQRSQGNVLDFAVLILLNFCAISNLNDRYTTLNID